MFHGVLVSRNITLWFSYHTSPARCVGVLVDYYTTPGEPVRTLKGGANTNENDSYLPGATRKLKTNRNENESHSRRGAALPRPPGGNPSGLGTMSA